MLKTTLSILLALIVPCSYAGAAVRLVTGPTPIIGGEARGTGDLTVSNDKLAFAIAVSTPAPYGVARGALIDLAPVVGGRIGRDRVTFADFIPNDWSAWPNRRRDVRILERSPQRVVIRTVRDWGEATLTTLYTLEAGADHVVLQATLFNGGARTLELRSGFTLWPKGGYLFGVPGLADPQRGDASGADADRVVAYDRDWSVALHAPYANFIGNGSRDMFRLYSLAPGSSRSFEAWLQVGAGGDLAPVVGAEIERKHLPAGTVRGRVTGSGGGLVQQPVIVVEKHGHPYAWTIGRRGRYALRLPAGSYRLYATAAGRSQSASACVDITAGALRVVDFHDLAPPGHLRFAVLDARSGAPLDARIEILQGQKPLVGFLGRGRFFTELDAKGRADLEIAPGRYTFEVSHGAGFLAEPGLATVELEPAARQRQTVVLAPAFDPPAHGWYAADMHHHADQAEAVTPAEYLARSELAAGLDVLFVSDHDSTVNHRALAAIAARRDMPFIPSVELSASWGHFNAYPLHLAEPLRIDTGTAAVGGIFAEARRLGAAVIQVNHPYIPYGYFTSVGAGVAPGGFDASFDVMEINATAPADDLTVVHRAWDEWNRGRAHYLSAGTDTHDVWNEESGRVRVFADPPGELTAASFAQALKTGRAYVTFGPLIFPSIVFGTRLDAAAAAAGLDLDLQSLAGLKEVQLIADGTVLETRALAGSPREAHVRFELPVARNAWFALIVEDVRGRRAYTDPIWSARPQ